MPIFEFKCLSCEATYERFVRDSETTTIPCLNCGKTAEKIVSIPNKFVWGRGGGWS